MNSKSGLMAGKRGLIMGVANDRSIAWGIAKAAHEAGAELAFTYQGEALLKRVKPLAESLGSSLVVPCEVTDDASLDATFAAVKQAWGTLDFVVHAIAFSDKEELKGKYVTTSRANFQQTMDISCYSFTDIARRASELMTSGGSLLRIDCRSSVALILASMASPESKAGWRASRCGRRRAATAGRCVWGRTRPPAARTLGADAERATCGKSALTGMPLSPSVTVPAIEPLVVPPAALTAPCACTRP